MSILLRLKDELKYDRYIYLMVLPSKQLHYPHFIHVENIRVFRIYVLNFM